MFVLGLTFTCPAGIHMFTLFNESAPSWNLLLLALIEVLVVGWIYGADRMLKDLEEMGMDIHPIMKIYWKLCWKFVTPIVLFVLLISALANFGHVSYEGSYTYPTGIQILGYFITGCTLVWVPIFAFIEINKKRTREFYPLLHPTTEWGRPEYGSFVEGKEDDGSKSEREKIPMMPTVNNP